jgi:hypothetical protein
MTAAKMKIETRLLIVNLAIIAALGFEYFRKVPILAILIAGILVLLVANIIFFVRLRKTKKAP